ncbi:MAG: M20/M25/M40 family metallo-hydrolase [Deltaproteobacteria bacterium]|nr:M20/M25/M40 family metallo-hydrolase [Deltaproteobacteria bacterium]
MILACHQRRPGSSPGPLQSSAPRRGGIRWAGRAGRSLGALLAVGVVLAGLAASFAANGLPSFSGPRAYSHVQELAGRIGPRPSGTPASDLARAYIAARLRSAGYRVEEQPFPIQYYEVVRSEMEVVSPVPAKVPGLALHHSGSGVAEGPLVDGGIGNEQALHGVQGAGAILLIRRGEIPFTQKVEQALRVGARGVVIYNHRPGAFQGSLRNAVAIPVLGITQEEGERLLQALRQGPVQARVAVEAKLETRTAYNVIGWPAAEAELLVTAHYDSVHLAPGANDNASGTAVMVEVAAALAGTPLGQRVGFVAFGAEEIGLLGSRHYVQGLDPGSRQRLRAVINVDTVGGLGGLIVLTARQVPDGPRRLADLALQLIRAAGLQGIREESTRAASDHIPFMQAGVPAVTLARQGSEHIHTPDDRPERVTSPRLADTGRIVLQLLEALQTSPALIPARTPALD